MATAGQTMLDTAGKAILRTDGTKQLSDGAGDDCCCAGHACYQLWTAYWDCELLDWVITQAGKFCLPDTTDESWMGSGCTGWTKYTAMSHVCTSDGDCSVYGDTATPDPPFPGEPPDCYCPCVEDCGCFNVGRTATVSFADVENGMPCIECPLGAGASQFFKAGGGTFGTYTLTRVASCDYELVVASGVSILQATGVTGGGCPPDGDFSPIDDGFVIELVFDGVSTWELTVRGPEFGAFFIGTAEQGDCDGPLVFANTIIAYNPCAGHEDLTINGTATVVFKPCTPP